jgi:transposase-like protein
MLFTGGDFLSLEKRKNKVYSAEMKAETVRLHLEEGLNP